MLAMKRSYNVALHGVIFRFLAAKRYNHQPGRNTAAWQILLAVVSRKYDWLKADKSSHGYADDL